jgi:hypothetical protein
MVTSETLVASEDIGWQVRAGDVADVDLGTGIGPGDGD